MIVLDSLPDQTIDVRFIARGRVRLLRDFTVHYGSADLTIPTGFEFDGASIPSFCWLLFGHPYSGSILPAALPHDYACRVRTEPSSAVHRAFYRCLRAHHIGRFRAGCMWLAVRLFGPTWNS